MADAPCVGVAVHRQQAKWYRGAESSTMCSGCVSLRLRERSSAQGRSSGWTRAFLRPAVLPALPDGAVHLAGLPHEKKERGKNNEYAGHRIDRRRVPVRCLRTLRPLAGKQVGHRPYRQDPDLEMTVFSMHLFHLEIKSEWQLEQHF